MCELTMTDDNHSNAVPDSGRVPDWTDLVGRIRVAQPGAMEELYRLFSRGIRFYIYRHLGPEDIDDKVHDAFVTITQSIQQGELREPERLMGYVRTIVRRQIAAHIDAAILARRTRIDVDFSAAVCDLQPDPERVAMNQQTMDMAMRILSSIPKRDREVLSRFYIEDQEPDQICAEMGLSPNQFRLIKSRAKSRFGELGKRRFHVARGGQ